MPQARLRHALEHPVDRPGAEDRVALRIHDRLPGANQSEHVGLERHRVAGSPSRTLPLGNTNVSSTATGSPTTIARHGPRTGTERVRRDQDRSERDCREMILTRDAWPCPDQERQVRAEEQEHERPPDSNPDADGVPHERSSPDPREQHQRRCRQTGRKLVGRIEGGVRLCHTVP